MAGSSAALAGASATERAPPPLLRARLASWAAAWQDWIFSAKTFAGAMLALLVGFTFDLPQPYWAMTTVYIVSQPLSGALRSKAIYRAAGTTLGAAATVAMVPGLVDAPELLSAALALWTGLCLYLSLLDRTPRSYVFLLAGYSAALIGFPSVANPAGVFDTAIARIEEITLGIVCATLVGSVVFPRPVGPVLSTRLDAWLRDAGALSRDALAGRRDDATLADRQRLAADAVELHMLATHLAYDTSLQQGATRWVRLLQQRMVMLLPVLSSITDRMAALRSDGAVLSSPVQAALADVSGWIAAGAETRQRGPTELAAAIARAERSADAAPAWHAMLQGSLLARLRELVEILQDCRDLRQSIAGGPVGAPPRRFAGLAGAGAVLHRDHGMAILSAAAAIVTVLVCCAFWIATGWADGAVAAEMAAVGCCIFAAQDDPSPAILAFTRAAAFSLVIAAIYLFAVLPAIDGFPLLVLVLAPTFLVLGFGMAKPRWTPTAMALAINAGSLMSLQDRYAAEFAAFLNSGLSLLSGLTVAAIMTGLVRSVGAEWSARRLLRAGWRDLASIASRARWNPAERAAFAARMLDRLGLLTPRLAAVAPGAHFAAADALADVRIGLNIVELQHLRPNLADSCERAISVLLDGLADFFRNRSTHSPEQRPSADLLHLLDDALSAVGVIGPGRPTRRLMLALVGIRRGLFPDAPPYRAGDARESRAAE